jgi:hypothetical protein
VNAPPGGLVPFAPQDVVDELRRRGSRLAASTIRTYVVSIMCIDAPDNHAVSCPDLHRVGRGPPSWRPARAGRAGKVREMGL